MQALVQFLQVTDLFFHHLVLGGLLFVRFFHRVAELGEFFAQRFEQDGELFCVQLGEFFRAVFEDFSGQALEVFRQALFRRFQLEDLLLVMLLAVRSPRLQDCVFLL